MTSKIYAKYKEEERILVSGEHKRWGIQITGKFGEEIWCNLKRVFQVSTSTTAWRESKGDKERLGKEEMDERL